MKSELTKAEQEILLLLTEELLTPKKIAIRRKTGVRAVQKIIRSLKEKGALNKGSQTVRFFEGTNEPNGIRLHAEQWIIKIISKDERYTNLIGKSVIIDNNTIRLHREAISVYSNKFFFGNDTWSATAKSIDYWNSFFTKLEWQFKVILIKPNVQNIERVRAEYAQIKNGLAIKCHKEAERIKIRAREDGKLWFDIDNSFNLKEAETKHPKTAEHDMQQVVEPFFNDLRDKPSYLPSDTKEMLNRLADITESMGKDYATNIKKHLSVLNNIDKSFKKFSKLLSERQKNLKEFF